MATNDTPQASLKSIFVISPIGKHDDDDFDFTTLFLNEIVKPAAEAAGGFQMPVRADEVLAPGSITAKVMRDIVKADVCIADLTHRNPNVMYEVAIAHAADKPVILLQQEPGGPPFDFTDERVIHYSTRADEANQAKRNLTEHLKNAHHEAEDEHLQKTMHPVRMIFRDLQTRASATEPEQAILERLDSITRAVKALQGAVLEQAPTSLAGRNDTTVESARANSKDVVQQLELRLLASLLLGAELSQRIIPYLTSDHTDGETLDLLYSNLKAAYKSMGEDRPVDPALIATAKMTAERLVRKNHWH